MRNTAIKWIFMFCILCNIEFCNTRRRNKEINLVSTVFKNLHQEEGVDRLTPRGLKFTSQWNSSAVPHLNLRRFWRTHKRSLSFYFSGQIIPQSKPVPIFSIYHRRKLLPYFEVQLDSKSGNIIIRYQGRKSFQRSYIQYGKPFDIISSIVLHLDKNIVRVHLGCEPVKQIKLRQYLQKFPHSAEISVQDRRSNEKFVGLLLEAKVYSYHNDKLSACNRAGIQGDEQNLRVSSQQGQDVRALQERLTRLTSVVDSLQAENSDLRAKLSILDTCVCYPQCLVNGVIHNDGDTWQSDVCTQCVCQKGQVQCHRRSDLSQCIAPCSSSPCQNQGYCVDVSPDPVGYQCNCLPPYDGPLCEVRQNPCVWPVEPGLCNFTVLRYYYDRFDEECRAFNYTGCGGNVNNYETIEACEEVAMRGACCFRRFRTDVDSLVSSDQMKESKCQVMSMRECKAMHRQEVDSYVREVVGYYPSLTCAEAQCGTAPSGCQYKGVAYQPGDVISQGCQKCTCQVDNRWTCSCVVRSVRKEIRDLTRKEITRLQVAIQKLRMSGQGNIWEKMREMYMSHGMHAHGGPYFLPWHRMFLRELEKSLQEIDCEITLPYFDFTTDVGSFDQAIVWQANYFGGNGDGRTNCVTDHNFGPLSGWQPCILRRFNNNVQLPSLLELALAISSDDYTEMSMCLESYISYLHQYIGGDMATNSAPYDPIFYPIYAYVDMLYWKWQQRGNNKFKYPAGFGNIPMIPFNIPPSSVLDLEGDLCVTYVLQSQGTPCNLTSDPGSDVSRGDIPAAEGGGTVIIPGYGRDGFDKMGYNFYGYNKTGFNRDGYDRDGYDVHGYNRYGYDREGYNRLGYNVNGYNRNGEPDTTGQYDRTGYDGLCLNRQGYTITGLDRYGFNQRGYNVNNCNYLNNGPFATIHTLRIWELLSIQDKAFLMSVPRVCPALGTVAPRWIQQFWISDLKDVSTMVPLRDVKFPLSLPTSRFCFDVELYISPCTCETSVSSCTENPCLTETCLSYPEAVCHIDFCSSCTATWYFEGRVVDCNDNRDFCQPNPCLNGGECVASIWPTEPQLVTCRCAPGFDGDRCQHPALEVCSLPKVSGNCGGQLTRWFYNQQTQSCERFLFTGCRGNANNFETEEACESRCEIGACCYRQPIYRKHGIGYNMQGYDRYGFNTDGANSRGVMRNANNSLPWGSNIYNTRGFDWQGYDKDGYNNKGRDRFGYDKEGYDNEGFNILGYNKKGDYDGITEYKETGYSVEGYNRVGMNCHGYNRRGLNYYGTSAGYTYKCRPMRLAQCQKMDERANIEVIQFTPGKRCEDVKCDDSCGCIVGDKSYEFGKTFMLGCQRCTCMITGAVQCECTTTFRRREIRDLTKEELQKFQTAIHILARKTGYPSKWFNIAKMYSSFKPQAVGSDGSLPWNRYFLKHVEQEMQALDCEVTIPYYDFTVDAGDPTRSLVWSANVFGGNGEGDNGCVTSHMFKEYNPPHWSPCLRRRFDTSVNLPDAVYVQYALNEPTYTRFRLRIEHMVNVFKSFVGGHMNSDLSPYDPLYLSFMAYIDKIWDQWQKKYPDGYLRFPPESRFKQMSPFKNTPDNVLGSEIQMCVEYVPITERRICNVTLPLYGYGPDGYDRHGFDRSGYDRDGYDVRGYDRSRNQDNRGIYNALGFDRHGYDRLGYDKNGMDRFGFYVDTYNLDGFDSEGYDRSGYDRYGFDRNGLTPSGFHKNGTWAVRPIPDVFDKYGYNRYGMNKYGFNRKGYDVFGFDSSGLDDEFCNQYFLGPMYMIIKRWTEQELEKLDNRTIRIITRICPAVSALPPWMYTVNWLRRGDQVALLETIQLQTGKDYRFDPNYIPRTSSVLDNKIWLPLSPDQRLCFVTYYYSECPFGKFPVSCPTDLCKGRACPGVTDALCRTNRCGSCSVEWYNGKTGRPVVCSGCQDDRGQERPEGSTWRKSECEICSCKGGRVECSNTVCPAVTCRYPVQLLGQCCPSCDAGCMYNDRIYENGQSFAPAQCEQCRCSRGDVTCGRVRCPDLGACQSMATPRGECCPVCMDCGEYANATQWSQSPCQRCSCINGVVKCEQIQCPAVTCRNPHTPDGQCCPQCISCSYEGKVVADGESFSPAPCQSCTCSQGTITCDKKQDCLPADCDNPVYPPGGCCPVCDSPCDYDMRTYQHMESFTASYDPCLNCSCVNSIVRCIPIHCPSRNLPCRSPIRRGENCCEYFCPSCTDGGRQYGNGETWTSTSDPCKECLCTEGVVTCRSTQNCPVTCSHGVKQTGECCSQCTEGVVTCRNTQNCPVTCSHGVKQTGECCSKCTDCIYNGRRYNDSQSFVVPGIQCQQCTCSRGNVRCRSSGSCPRLPCTVTETEPGECCPRCKGCDFRGRMYNFGDTVRLDSCTRCFCRDGQLECKKTDCAPPSCENPEYIDGRCCPVCRGCQYNGRSYREGQRFNPPNRQCETCVCENGRVSCTSAQTTCPRPPCTHPQTIPGECCPSCRDCLYLRRKFRNGQKFIPPGGDTCRVCSCANGNITCAPTKCQPLNCQNPVKPPGYCCGVCPTACTVRGRKYKEGQTFTDPRNRCNICTCKDGEIDCQPMTCQSPRCRNPVKRPNDCCPTCFMCEYRGLILRNRQSFANPTNKCEKCLCEDGTVTCRPNDCPAVNCIDPIRKPGECCDSCPEQVCQEGGRRYREGQTFPSSRDPCLECVCRKGRADCSRRVCPDVTCKHPVYQPGSCCAECSDCTFEGLIFRNGQSFKHPSQKCQECNCVKGNVICGKTSCPPTNCQYPVMNGCCPVCTGCYYQNREYPNGKTFQNLVDPCLVCMCSNGNVVQKARQCPAVSCQHPVQGRCCPECNDCMFERRRYRDGQRFVNPADRCQTCTCGMGTVTCSMMPCPIAKCSNPTQGPCCPECKNCMVDGREVLNGQPVRLLADQCQSCVCRDGSLDCRQKRCPGISCRHPAMKQCCSECTDCFYQGQEHRNGTIFSDPAEKCNDCQCLNGNVNCMRRDCPAVRCNSPATTDCCPVCGNCSYRGQTFPSGASFPDRSDICTTCRCSGGNINCAKKRCPSVRCSHPVQGQCCPKCGGDCLYDNKRIRNGASFSSECQDCTCVGGSVRCTAVRCPATRCSHPANDRCCQVCDDCNYGNRRYRNGQRFPDVNDRCRECQCTDGSVRCSQKTCPDVTCQNPVTVDCCPVCTNCLYRGRTLRNGQSIPGDACQTCTCQFGTVACSKNPCKAVSCREPAPDSCNCPACDKCSYQGREYADGERLRDNSDPCQDCVCRKTEKTGCSGISEQNSTCLEQNGNVDCYRRRCVASCTHPSEERDCCPVCRDCLYEGRVRRNGEDFDSELDPCQTCTCRDGSIFCEVKPCPALSCPSPVTMPGECCPACPVCNFMGGIYEDGTSFVHPQDQCRTCNCQDSRVQCVRPACDVPCSHPAPGTCCPSCTDCMFEDRPYSNRAVFKPDPCRTCQCRDGTARCQEESCPRLTCTETEMVPGECCPRCKSCTFNGRQYVDGSEVISEEDPCLVCMCNAGTMTCMEMRCLATCDNPVTFPGQCCPICPTCRHRGRTYQDGDVFSPTGDPCDVCTCLEGTLRCRHQTCPELASCPQDMLQSPPPGECCPSCRGGSLNCTQRDVGTVIKPDVKDPCFYCECKGSNHWLCKAQGCPRLNCPPAVQKITPGECCPTCPVCHDMDTDLYYEEGDVWSDDNNPCKSCQCQQGRIVCRLFQCPPLRCSSRERMVTPPGQCCSICEPLPQIECFYQGIRRQPGERFKPDDCTTCDCLGGEVKCSTETCPPISCGVDEVPSAPPGACCPVCIAKPGTCIVFGDPHYQSFDGTMIHMQGSCKYIMTKDCENNDFTVEVQHDDRGMFGVVSWAQNFTVGLGGTQIDLLQQQIVQVDGRSVSLPYAEQGFSVERNRDTLLLNTAIGVQVTWNGDSNAEVSVPGTYKGKTCGLCGNFNGFPQDDLRTRSGVITNSPSVFGNSWKAPIQNNDSCADSVDIDPCVKAGYRARKAASAKCAVLTTSKFSSCHRVVAPDTFFASCVYDMCVCMDNSSCLCEILSSYAKECAKNGVQLQWREPGLCDFPCDTFKGFVFDECGPVCPRTCKNLYTPPENMEARCFKPCIASCQCPADKVLHNGECIPTSRCSTKQRGDITVNG